MICPVLPPPIVSAALVFFRALLHIYLRHTKAGQVFAAPTDVVLSDVDVVQPDLLFVASARHAIITETHIHGAPDLVIEILSATSRKTDAVIKRKLYERHGIPEYWIVDPELETVTVYRLVAAGGYERAAERSREAGDTRSSPA